MTRTDEFLKELQTKLNTIITTYFEEAPPTATFPFAIFQNASIRGDDNSETTLIDISIYQKTDKPTLEVETILKNIKNGLDRTAINVSGKFSSYLYFESSDNVRDQDVNLISRRATFTARIFYL